MFFSCLYAVSVVSISSDDNDTIRLHSFAVRSLLPSQTVMRESEWLVSRHHMRMRNSILSSSYFLFLSLSLCRCLLRLPLISVFIFQFVCVCIRLFLTRNNFRNETRTAFFLASNWLRFELGVWLCVNVVLFVCIDENYQ